MKREDVLRSDGTLTDAAIEQYSNTDNLDLLTLMKMDRGVLAVLVFADLEIIKKLAKEVKEYRASRVTVTDTTKLS
jgi:hypothetical protein